MQRLDLSPDVLKLTLERRLAALQSDVWSALVGIGRLPEGLDVTAEMQATKRTFAVPTGVTTSQSIKSASTWVAGHALGHAIEIISSLCDETWWLLELGRVSGRWHGRPITGLSRKTLKAVASAVLGQEGKSIEKDSFDVKIKKLKQYNLSCDGITHLADVVKLRNCLIHRFGVVDDVDLNDEADRRLVVEIRSAEIRLGPVHSEDKKTGELLEAPTVNQMLFCPNAPRQLSYSIGDRIQMSHQDVIDVLWCVGFSGQEFVREVRSVWPTVCKGLRTQPE